MELKAKYSLGTWLGENRGSAKSMVHLVCQLWGKKVGNNMNVFGLEFAQRRETEGTRRLGGRGCRVGARLGRKEVSQHRPPLLLQSMNGVLMPKDGE